MQGKYFTYELSLQPPWGGRQFFILENNSNSFWSLHPSSFDFILFCNARDKSRASFTWGTCSTIESHSQLLKSCILWGGYEEEAPSNANQVVGYQEIPRSSFLSHLLHLPSTTLITFCKKNALLGPFLETFWFCDLLPVDLELGLPNSSLKIKSSTACFYNQVFIGTQPFVTLSIIVPVSSYVLCTIWPTKSSIVPFQSLKSLLPPASENLNEGCRGLGMSPLSFPPVLRLLVHTSFFKEWKPILLPVKKERHSGKNKRSPGSEKSLSTLGSSTKSRIDIYAMIVGGMEWRWKGSAEHTEKGGSGFRTLEISGKNIRR